MTSKNRVREAIRERGHTYESLGAEIGISAQAVSEIVHGRTTGATARYAVAKALKKTVGQLWPESEAPRAVA